MINTEITHSEYTDSLFHNAKLSLFSNSYKGLVDKDEFFTNLTGVSYGNRQQVIRSLQLGQELFMRHDHTNHFHSNAIKLVTENEQEVGFLPKDLADEMIKTLNDDNHLIFVEKVFGEGEYKGISVVIQKIKSIFNESLTYKYPINMLKEDIMEDIAQKLGVMDLYKKKKDIIQNFNYYTNISFYGNDEYEKNIIIAIQFIYRILRYGKKEKVLYLFNDTSTLMEMIRLFNLISQKFAINIKTFNPKILAKKSFNSYIEDNEVDVLITTYSFFNKIDLNYKFSLIIHNHIDQNLKYLNIHDLKKLKSNTTLFNQYNFDKMTKEELRDNLNVKQFIKFSTEGSFTLIDKRNINNKKLFIFNFLYKRQKSIIYTNTRKRAIDLARSMKAKLPKDLKYKVIFYHAGLSIEDKKIIERKFKNNEYLFIIATTAFDIALHGDKLVKNIFIFNPSYSLNTFLNQVVQTTKFNECRVFLIYSFNDIHKNKEFIINNIVDKNDLAYIYKSLQYMLLNAFREKYGYFHCKKHELRELVYNLFKKRYTNQQIEVILKTLDDMKVIHFEKYLNDIFIEVYDVVEKSDFKETQTYTNNLILRDMFVEFELMLTDNIQQIKNKLFK